VAKYEVMVGIGLANGCERVAYEIDVEDEIMPLEEWNQLTEEQQQDILYDGAWENVQEHFEVWVRDARE